MTKRKFLIVALAFMSVLLLASTLNFTFFGGTLTAQAEAPSEGKTLISLVEATVAVPVAGETVSTTANTDNTLYKVSEVKWYDVAAEKDLNRYSKFAEGKQYTTTVKFQVTSVSDYDFDKENIVAKINGQSAEVVSVFPAFAYAKYTFTVIAEPVPKYTVTIENGTLEDGETSGYFQKGENVKIIADPAPEGKAFVEWEAVSGNVLIPYSENQTTSFTMTDKDVKIQAVFKTFVPRVEITLQNPIAGNVKNNNVISYPSGKGYTAVVYDWYKEEWGKLNSDEPFVLEQQYLVKINVTAEDGYFFTKETEAYVHGIEDIVFDQFSESFEIRHICRSTAEPLEFWDVNVVGGWAEIDENKAFKAESGNQVTLHAEVPENMTFVKWKVVSGRVILADENSATTTFNMVESNVEVQAVYKGAHTHSYVYAEEKLATCAAGGTRAHYTCSGCEKLFDESKNQIDAAALATPVNPNAHNLEEAWTATKDGHYHVCKNVGCAVGHDEIQAHTPDRTDATETDPVKCTVCNYTIEAAIGHTHKLTFVPERASTCTENGTKSHYVCSGCGHKFSDEAAKNQITDESTLTIRMAHRFGAWVEEVPATTETVGTKAHKDCEFCHKHFDEHDNEIEDLTIC